MQLQPVPASAKFTEEGYFVWCGSMTRTPDGKCHLFYSRWPRRFGFEAWVTHSEVARAVADRPLGPYHPADVVLPARGKEHWDGLCTHNPTVLLFDGRYYLYYMGNTQDGAPTQASRWTQRNHQRIGVAVADRPDGPWQRFDRPLIAPTPGFHDALCCANPSVLRRPGGKDYLMVYKAVGDRGELPFGGPVVHVVATASHPLGPFVKFPEPAFTSQATTFAAEDPFIWCQNGHYWAIVKDMGGYFTGAGTSLALFGSSDGVDWQPAGRPLVSTLGLHWEEGEWQPLARLERPQVWLENGEPAVLFCAAMDAGRNETFNVAIPLKAVSQPGPVKIPDV